MLGGRAAKAVHARSVLAVAAGGSADSAAATKTAADDAADDLLKRGIHLRS